MREVAILEVGGAPPARRRQRLTDTGAAIVFDGAGFTAVASVFGEAVVAAISQLQQLLAGRITELTTV